MRDGEIGLVRYFMIKLSVIIPIKKRCVW